jgi:hypothetical protein
MPRRFRMLATGVALVLAALAPATPAAASGISASASAGAGGNAPVAVTAPSPRRPPSALAVATSRHLPSARDGGSSAITSSRSSGLWSWSI